MKRKCVRMMLCMALALGMMAMVACGSKSDSSSADSQTEAGEDADAPEEDNDAEAPEENNDAEAPEEDASTDDQESGTAGGKFATIADYVNSPDFQSQLEAQMSQLEGSGLDMSITGEGDNLVYSYTYLELESQEGMAEALETAVEQQRATFVQVANSLRAVVDVENPVVVIKYLAPDGSEIYSTEIPAE